MTIIAICGDIGAGKSFTLIKEALKMADKREKQLVCNFNINLQNLYEYASLPKAYDSYYGAFICELRRFAYALRLSLSKLGLPRPKRPRFKPRLPWIKKLCEDGGAGIIQLPYAKNLEALIDLPNSVVCIDEAGILLNSRNFQETTRELLAGIVQSRKMGVDLIWTSQFNEQVDRQLRELTHIWVHCQSTSIWDKKLRRPRLKWKSIYWFKAASYLDWLRTPRDRDNPIKTRWSYSTDSESGVLSPADKKVFGLYDSFARLDGENSFSLSSRGLIEAENHNRIKTLREYRTDLHPLYFYKQKQFFPVDTGVQVLSRASNVVSLTTPDSQSNLVKQAISLARAKQIKSAPYFKSMSSAELNSWISKHSS